MIRKNLIILGSTGSIGNQVLDIVRQNEDKFNVLGISNFSNNKLFIEQIDEFCPKYISSPSEINEFKGENLKLEDWEIIIDSVSDRQIEFVRFKQITNEDIAK